jgi:FkbM family methyltransferase
MSNKVNQLLGMDWRIPAYRRYVFYYIICSNYLELIRFDRTRRPFQNIMLRSGQVIRFNEIDQAMQIFLEIWFKRLYTCSFVGHAPRVVVDIGANIGLFSLLARQLWPNSIIHAYEPEPQNFALLQSNMFSQGCTEQLTNLHPHSTALGETKGELSFYIKKASGWHSIYPGDSIEAPVIVSAIDLPNLVNDIGGRIDFLKIDCEGCEWTTLLRHNELLKNSVGYIAMEYHEVGQHAVSELTQALSVIGFSTTVTNPDAWKTGMLYAKNHAYPFS